MHLPDAIQCHISLERVRRPHLKHGSAILRRLKFFVLYHCHRQCSKQQFRVLERFEVLMYSRTSPHQDVNHARQSMFSQGTRSIESIPPTQAALEQHVKRAAELIKCGCKSACRGLCKCTKANLPYTAIVHLQWQLLSRGKMVKHG